MAVKRGGRDVGANSLAALLPGGANEPEDTGLLSGGSLSSDDDIDVRVAASATGRRDRRSARTTIQVNGTGVAGGNDEADGRKGVVEGQHSSEHDDGEHATTPAAAATKATALPRRFMAILFVGLTSNGMALTFLFPFAGFMVTDFGVTEDHEKIGYFAGKFHAGRATTLT